MVFGEYDLAAVLRRYRVLTACWFGIVLLACWSQESVSKTPGENFSSVPSLAEHNRTTFNNSGDSSGLPFRDLPRLRTPGQLPGLGSLPVFEPITIPPLYNSNQEAAGPYDPGVLNVGLLLLGLGEFMSGSWPFVIDTLSAEEIVSIERQQQFSWSWLRWLDTVSTTMQCGLADGTSDLLLYSSVTAPIIYGLFALPQSQQVDDRSSGDYVGTYASALAVNYVLNSVVKHWVQRKRPYLFNREIEVSEKLKNYPDYSKSFYSGHTAFAFMAAAFLTRSYADYNPGKHEELRVIGYSSFSAATLTGLFRILAGKHFPTDVIVGAAIGTLVGWGVPQAMK